MNVMADRKHEIYDEIYEPAVVGVNLKSLMG